MTAKEVDLRLPASAAWQEHHKHWQEHGFVVLPPVLNARACQQLIAQYACEDRFRKRIDMARHSFGRGEYSYFAYPLPRLVERLRTRLYAALAPWANEMMSALRKDERYPATHSEFVERCRAVDQAQPTALMLRYRAGDYNRLHRDLYGAAVFPIQCTLVLSADKEYEGGEFVLVENRPRQQSIATSLRPQLGQMIIFPVADRPVPGARAMLRASVRHGVSQVRSGERWTLGIIFHDAK